MRKSSENYRIYEAIHPISDSDQTVVDYLDTLDLTIDFFDEKLFLIVDTAESDGLLTYS